MKAVKKFKVYAAATPFCWSGYRHETFGRELLSAYLTEKTNDIEGDKDEKLYEITVKELKRKK